VGEARDFSEELAQRLEARREGKEGAILVTGYPKSGKTSALGAAAGRLKREMLLIRAEAVQIAGGTGVQLVLKDGRGAEVVLDDTDRGLNFIRERMKEGVVVAVELPKSLYFPGATEGGIEELRELLRRLVDGLRRMSAVAPFAIEGNNYTFHFIEGREEGPSAKDPEGKLRWIAKHLKFMIGHEREVLGPPEGSVEVAYGEAEAKALLEKLAENLDEKEKELVLRSARVNHGLYKGYYFPGLLVKGIEHPEALDKKRIEELEHFEEQLKVDAVGVGLANAAYEGASSTIARYAGEVLRTASGIFTSLLTFGLGLGASAGVLFLFGLARKSEDPVKQVLEMREKWEKLPEERKEYLGYRYDAALALPPGTARRWLDDFFHQGEDRIRQMIEELRGDIEELREAVRELEDEIAELKEEIARTAGYRRLNSEEEAGHYFGLESRDSLEPVWMIVDEVSGERVTVDQLVEGLVNDAKSGTGRVYLVRGEAGVGKSALAFYASCELLSRSGGGEALRVLQQARSVNLGAHISGRGEELRVLAAEGSFRPDAPNEPGTVVFLDDGKLADYEEEISNVLRGVVERLMADGGEGGPGLHYPLVITVSDERWNFVEAALLRGENPAITSEDHREKWRAFYGEGKVIRRLSVRPLEEADAREVLRSIMEKGDPPMSYDKQDKDVIEELLNKAGGYPLILKEFIKEFKVKELQGKGRERIEMSDVQAISGGPHKYVVNRLKEAYFRPLGLLKQGLDLLDSVPFHKRVEACKLLSFLYQLRKGLPAGLLLPKLADATPPGTLVDIACGVLEGLYGDCRPTFGMRLPLCSSYAGELRLSHPLASDILEDARRIVDPEDARRIAEGDEEVGGDDPLSFLRSVECEGGQFESVGVKDLVEDAINYYRRGMRSTGLGPVDYFYGLFSLLLYSRDASLIGEVLLSRNVLKDAGSIGEVPEEVRREVLDQLYELLQIAKYDERLKTYYLLLLDNDHGYLDETWSSVPDLIRAGVISKEDAAARKKGFLELLENVVTKMDAWGMISDLIEAGVISKEDAAARKKGFLELLESNNVVTKWLAWGMISDLIEAGVISKEDAAARKKGFLELLENEWMKWLAWGMISDLIEAGVISKEDAAAHKEGLLELLENEGMMRQLAWDMIFDLIEAGVISKEDLIEAGVISKEDLTSSPP